MNENPKRGRLEPILDKLVIDKLEELRKEAIPLFEKSMADDDGDSDDKLAEAIEYIGTATAYFRLYHAAVDRAERALKAFKEYRKKEEEDHERQNDLPQ